MPLTNIIILALLAVAAIAAMGLGWMISKKNGAAGLGLKAVLALCLCVVVGCTAFVAVAAATGTLKPEVPEPAFDPEMNGHYENVVADNGDIYTGDFAAGYYHGVGKVTYTDGSTYDGAWVADKPNGEGTYTSAEGWVYKGQFVNGVKTGNGFIRYSDGSWYDGQWENNVKHGQGTHTYHDETGKLFGTYVGGFASDKRNGEGKLIYENGYVQEGRWENDNFLG